MIELKWSANSSFAATPSGHIASYGGIYRYQSASETEVKEAVSLSVHM